ncbi:hypothetical protein pb186bvf_002969 [Paramecium bursaria]
MNQVLIEQGQPILDFLKENKSHPYEIVTLMIQMAQIVDDFHNIHHLTLGRFKLKDFTIQNIPNTNNYRVKFIGQPNFDKLDKIQGQDKNQQQIYEAPDLYQEYFDYQSDIYQLGVWFGFYDSKQIYILQKYYMPQVTWVIQTMLERIPSCRPGLDVVIQRLLQFEFKGKIVINNCTFIVKKKKSLKVLTKQQQFYSLTQRIKQ